MTVGEDQAPAETAPDETEGTDELGVLFPDREVEVRDPDSGEPVALTLREFRFREGLEVQVQARPLVEALANLVTEDGTEIAPVEIDATIGAQPDLWIALIARATDREPDWIARLDDRAARDLTALMWAVNAPFFCRRGIESALGTRDLASLYLSAASSLRSSPPATAEETATAVSPINSRSGKSGSSGAPPKSAARMRSPPPELDRR